jgi:solute carrier family 35 protein F5
MAGTCFQWGRRGLGLLCLLGVVLIWVISGELIEFIFTNQNFSAPFFITYFNTGLFTLYLLGFLFRPAWWGDAGPPSWMPWMRLQCLGRTHEPCLAKHQSEDVDEAAPTLQADSTAGPAESSDQPTMLSMRDVAWIALGFCPLWFGANYLYNLSLSFTSVASATILSATSSLFTFGLSCACKVEKPTVWKLAGLLIMLGGVVLVSLLDTSNERGDSIVGDAFALAGAVIYAGYAVYLKTRLDERRVHMPMFFGFVGLFNILLMWPLGLVLHFTGWEQLRPIPGAVVGSLFANGLVGTVISDYLWVLAVLLVSPVVATAGTISSVDFVFHSKVAQYADRRQQSLSLSVSLSLSHTKHTHTHAHM